MFRYQLVDNTNIFEIGQNSGVMRARVQLDRETVSTHTVKVRVTDGGTPTMTSTLTVQIDVKDLNDNPSEPRDVSVMAYVVQGQFTGDVIADLHPNDLDIEGDYSCSLTSQPGSFSISEACDLYASRVTSSTSDLDLQGSDGVHPEVAITADVDFVELSEDALKRTVVMRLGSLTVAQFLTSYYSSMQTSITSVLPTGSTLYLYSVQQDAQDERSVLVYVIVKQTSGAYMDHNVLLNTIQAKKSQIEREVALVLRDVHYDPCAQNYCQNDGECTSTLDVISDEMVLADSPRVCAKTKKRSLCLKHRFFFTLTFDFDLPFPCTNPCHTNGTILKPRLHVPFKNGFSAVLWCCLHLTLKRSKVPLIEMVTLTVRVNQA